MDGNALLRRQLLESIYDKMSPEEKRMFAMMSLQQRSADEILQALQRQHADISRMAGKMERQSWWTDFSSDILANFTTDGMIWLVRRLFR